MMCKSGVVDRFCVKGCEMPPELRQLLARRLAEHERRSKMTIQSGPILHKILFYDYST